MKRILYAVLVGFLLIGAPASLLAQNSSDTTETRVIGEDGETKTFPIRLDEAKKQFSDKITKAKEARIKQTCTVAQTKIKSVLDKTQTFQARHNEIHQQWLTKLADLGARVALTDVDTTIFNSYTQELNALVVQSSSDLENYIAGLEDVSTLECEADVTGFYSALQAARAMRSLVVDDTKEVLAYIRSNIKPELQNIKQQLQDANEGRQ